MVPVLILNFSHPLTVEHLDKIQQLAGQETTRVQDIPVQLNNDDPVAPQVEAIVDGIPLGGTEWQTTPFLVNLPGFSIAAAAIVAELHGRSGHFPACIRLRPVADSVPVRFEVAEIVGLEQIRQAARERRAQTNKRGAET